MAGHNKWSKIKHKKGANDAKRSKVWTKIIREITVAAKMGGGDPDGNPRLRKALDDARAANMPKDTMNRAVTKGAGGGDDANFEELTYEGYAPGGVALLIECATDNRNRTGGDVRSTLSKGGGNLGTSGSVSFMFDKRGQIMFAAEPEEGKKPTEDDLLELGMEHGAEDVATEDGGFVVTCEVPDFHTLLEAYKAAGYVPASADLAQLPQNMVAVQGDAAHKLLRLIDKLEDLDDVQNVWSNADISEEDAESYGG